MVLDKLFSGRSEAPRPIGQEEVREALRAVRFGGYSRDIVSFGIVKDIRVEEDGARVRVVLEPNSTNQEAIDQMALEARNAVARLPGVRFPIVEVVRSTPPAGSRGAGPRPAPLPGIARTIAVASGKGGVGKSTVSANLAAALAAMGARVGLMDADIHGPNIPQLFGLTDAHEITSDERLVPVRSRGVHIVSLALIAMGDTPVIWRGPMVAKMVTQFIHRVAWPELDLLVVDLPPGTGDVQLSLVQQVGLDGALIVTTPQELSLLDARKGLRMFQTVETPVLGIVENMSYHVCSSCGHEEFLFGRDGGGRVAEELGIPLLGRIPLDPRVQGDAGTPCVLAFPQSAPAEAFRGIATAVRDRIEVFTGR